MLLVPEDVVVKETVTVVGGLLCDLGSANRAVPDEGGGAIQGLRGGGEGVEWGTEVALSVDRLFAPELAQQGVVLDGQVDALADVLAEPGIDGAGVAAAQHEVHAAVG